MSYKTRWIDLIYIIATSSQKIRNIFTPLGAFIYALVILVFIMIAAQLDGLIGITAIFPKTLAIIVATPFFLAATVLIGWSVLTFLRAKGTPVPVNPPPQLVKTGPYAYVRNPMLAGVFALLFGIGVLLGSISLLVIFTPLFILINVWELKMIEEPELLKRLGRDYIDYRNSTPMFVPFPRKIFQRGKMG